MAVALGLSALAGTVASTNVLAQGGPKPTVANGELHRLDVHVGTSTVISAPWPVSRVSITQPGIADVQVLTPKQVLVTGNALGSTDLILWSEDEQIWHARIEVLIDLSFIKGELAKLFPTSELDVTQSRDMVVITGAHRRTDDVMHMREVMDSYGIKYVDSTNVAGVHQVMLNVRVAEASRQAIRALGVNLIYRGDNVQFATLPGPDGGTPLGSPGLVQNLTQFASATSVIANINGIDLQMLLQALTENQYARILAEPKLVALSGEEASFLAGGEFPIPVVQGGGGGDNNTSISIEYKEFGVKLKFKPTVLGDNTIRMKVAPEVSSLSEIGAVEIEGFRVPSLLTRRAETTLEMRSGQTFAIAGLMNDEIDARNSRIPLLGDLPVLGVLFRSVRYKKKETELLVLVTASLVEPINRVRPIMLPGETHVEPSDWELYVDGRIEGKVPMLAPVDAEWYQSKGLDRLKGPGAWTTHDQAPAVSEAEMHGQPAPTTQDTATEPN